MGSQTAGGKPKLQMNLFKPFALALLAASVPLALHAGSRELDDESEVIGHELNPHSHAKAPTAGSTGASTPIFYHTGGAVMGSAVNTAESGVVNVYVIWYGNWAQKNGTDTAAGQQIVLDFLNGIGGSPYNAINTTYSTISTTIQNAVQYKGAITDTGSAGTRLSDSAIQTLVKNAILKGKLPSDPKGVYFVLTSSNISTSSGFCTRYCGWHTHTSVNGVDIKYSFVGNAARCLTSCAPQSVSPNGNAGVDGMVSVLAHELVETVSDPDLNAWYDSSGAENADKCAWTFGQSQYQVANGAFANMKIGARDYLIQRNLLRTGNGDFCAVWFDPATKTAGY